ncbi:MAG: AEC family transporter [Anaerolineae bacterium]|nr:AEC family transporter [Anaerolineae bacterium]
MEQAIQILNQVLPILLLISLGYWTRYRHFLGETTIDELRKIVVNLALPAVLFVSFLNVELKSAYFVIFGFTFVLCILLFLLGNIIRRQLNIRYTYFPYLTTGFEYGMLGISLFGAAYGLEKIGYIAVADLGHEIFIWFVFLPLLLIKRDGVQNATEIVRSFLSAPVVIAILAGILFNILGLQAVLYQLPITGALMTVFEFLGNLTVPLILIIVGYGIKINRAGLGDALLIVIIRLGILIPLAFIVNIYLIRGFLQLDRLFETALFTLLILPPPFIVPLYTSSNLSIDEKQYINNVLTIHTIISVAVFIVYFVLNPVM